MSKINSPSEMLATLHDIHTRSQQRAAELSQHDRHGSWTTIGFRIGEEHLLAPLNETREIFTVPKQITLVPRAQPWVYGAANLRGELLPLFDLKHFLTGQATKVTKRSRIVISNHSDLYSGLLLDEVFGLKHFPAIPEYKEDHSGKAISPYITASIDQHDIQWKVFSFEKLLSDQRFLNAAA